MNLEKLNQRNLYGICRDLLGTPTDTHLRIKMPDDVRDLVANPDESTKLSGVKNQKVSNRQIQKYIELANTYGITPLISSELNSLLLSESVREYFRNHFNNLNAADNGNIEAYSAAHDKTLTLKFPVFPFLIALDKPTLPNILSGPVYQKGFAVMRTLNWAFKVLIVFGFENGLCNKKFKSIIDDPINFYLLTMLDPVTYFLQDTNTLLERLLYVPDLHSSVSVLEKRLKKYIDGLHKNTLSLNFVVAQALLYEGTDWREMKRKTIIRDIYNLVTDDGGSEPPRGFTEANISKRINDLFFRTNRKKSRLSHRAKRS